MSLAVIKFSSEDCGICHKMSFYDHKVAKELNLDFIDVKMQDTATYRKYRKILLSQYPNKEESLIRVPTSYMIPNSRRIEEEFWSFRGEFFKKSRRFEEIFGIFVFVGLLNRKNRGDFETLCTF